ncbi:hypothetical protein BGZ73_003887 [Actinomortierella ambigua]|nr:hypothetical protein BGZ73_003887 [Actinomortierella ambigua]
MDSNRRAFEVQLLKMASQVMMVCTDVTLDAIVNDLRMTQSPDLTISRILDGLVQVGVTLKTLFVQYKLGEEYGGITNNDSCSMYQSLPQPRQPPQEPPQAPRAEPRQDPLPAWQEASRYEPRHDPLPQLPASRPDPVTPKSSRMPTPADVIDLISSSEDEKVVKKEKLQERPPKRARIEPESIAGPSSARQPRPPREEKRVIDPFLDDQDHDLWNDSYEPNVPPPPPPLDIAAMLREASSSPARKASVTRSPLQRTTTSRNLHVSSSPLSTSQEPLPRAPISSVRAGKQRERATLDRLDTQEELSTLSIVDDQDDDWDFDLHESPISYKQIAPEMDDRPVIFLSPKGAKAPDYSSSKLATAARTPVDTLPGTSDIRTTPLVRRGASTSTHVGSSSYTSSTGSAAIGVRRTTSPAASLPRKLFDDHDNDSTMTRSLSASRIGSKLPAAANSRRDVFDEDEGDDNELWNDEDERDYRRLYGFSPSTARKPALKDTIAATVGDARATGTTTITTTTTTTTTKGKRGRPPRNAKATPTSQAEGFDFDQLREWQEMPTSVDDPIAGINSRTTSSAGTTSRGRTSRSSAGKARASTVDRSNHVEILDDDYDDDDTNGVDRALGSGSLSFEQLLDLDSQELIGNNRVTGKKAAKSRATTTTTRNTRSTTRKTRSKGAGRSAPDGSDPSDDDDDGEDDEKAAAADDERAALTAQKEKQERRQRAKEERERKRQQQEEQREQRDREKRERENEKEKERVAVRELRIANRVSSKSESARELILCIEREMFHSAFGKVLQHHLKPLGLQVETLKVRSSSSSSSSSAAIAENTSWQDGIQSLGTCSLQDMMYWKRGVTHRYDEAQDQYLPIGRTEIELEPFILLYLRASDFANQAKNNLLQLNLETARREIRRMCNMDLLSMSNPSANLGDLAAKRDRIRVLYVIQGMDAYIRGLRRVITKNFQAAVLAKIQTSNGGTDGGETATVSGAVSVETSSLQSAEAAAEQEQIEAELLRLQVQERCKITHAVDDDEAAEVIVALTEQIGYAPYKPKFTTNVCMDGIKSGQNADDTWMKALQGISMVTHQVAKSIVAEYPTIRMLYEGYRQCRTIEEAEGMLSDIEIIGKRRFVGPSVSKRVYDIFMGQDPNKVVT